MDFDYEVIADPQLVGDVANALDREEKFAFDLETTSLDFNRGAIHGIGVATKARELNKSPMWKGTIVPTW